MSFVVDKVNKTYKSGILPRKKFKALHDISFELEKGSVLALIGQNGAGKTTLIKCILSLLQLDSGSISMDNKNIVETIQNGELRYMPESLKNDGMITLKEYITDLMVLRDKDMDEYEERYEMLMDKFHMRKHANKNFTQFSKGTMKKAVFIQAVLHNPSLLILDEPTDGLDPVSRRALLNEVLEIKKNGGTVIITTHLLSDLSIVADKVVVLQNGDVIAESLMDEMKESLEDWYIDVITKQGGLDEL